MKNLKKSTSVVIMLLFMAITISAQPYGNGDCPNRGDKKGTFSFIVGPKSEYEEEQPDIQSDEFEFDFNGIVVITKDLYVVDGGANAGFDNEGDEIQPVIELKFKIPKNPDWQKVSFDMVLYF